ncbi:hypothetical protein K0M31_007066, partial [Melipona bicolor]
PGALYGACTCETASKLLEEGCAQAIRRESELESIFCIAWRCSDLPASRRSPGTVTPGHIQCTGGAPRRNIAARKPFHGETNATSGKPFSRQRPQHHARTNSTTRKASNRTIYDLILDSSHYEQMFLSK